MKTIKKENYIDDYIINDGTMNDSIEVVSAKKDTSKSKKRKLIGGILSTFFVASAISGIINVCLSDNPENKNYYIENLFSGNSYSSNVTSDQIDLIIDNLEEKLGCEIVEANEDEYCLLNAILENPNLSKDEKNQFYNSIDLILENPYINKEDVYHAFSYVDVEYHSGDYGNIYGNYDYTKNLINIYDPAGGNTLSHESIHCIFSNENTKTLPKYFKEGMTELLNNEYFDDQYFAELYNYYYEVVSVKLLCTLTSSDTVLKAYTTGDMSVISEELAKNAGTDLYLAEDAMIKLNVTFDRIYSGTFDPNNQKMLDDFNVVLDYFNMCASNMELDNETQDAYIYNSLLLKDLVSPDLNDRYLEYLDKNGYDTKVYFSKKLDNKTKFYK